MQTLKAKFTIVTPMFLGGHGGEPDDGIRPPSIKGALRFWWRALNWSKHRLVCSDDVSAFIAMHREEARLFGHAAEKQSKNGQASFLLRVTLNPSGKSEKNNVLNAKAGAHYFGYGLMSTAGKLTRGCLNRGQDFELTLLFRNGIDTSIRDALIAWGLLGGLGSRTRRAYGSVALKSIEVDGKEDWELPGTAEQYFKSIQDTLKRYQSAAIGNGEPPFTALSQHSRIDCLTTGNHPIEVINELGRAMLLYRSWGRSNGGPHIVAGGDLSEKRFVADHAWAKNTRLPNFHPVRVAFGLPHNYGDNPLDQIEAERHKRRASPLLFHVHPVGIEFLGVSVYLPAQFLPAGEKINAGGVLVPASIDWSVITDFMDGELGNPATGIDRFPARNGIWP